MNFKNVVLVSFISRIYIICDTLKRILLHWYWPYGRIQLPVIIIWDFFAMDIFSFVLSIWMISLLALEILAKRQITTDVIFILGGGKDKINHLLVRLLERFSLGLVSHIDSYTPLQFSSFQFSLLPSCWDFTCELWLVWCVWSDTRLTGSIRNQDRSRFTIAPGCDSWVVTREIYIIRCCYEPTT